MKAKYLSRPIAIWLTGAFLTLCGGIASAQGTASISGSVVDSTQSVVAQSQVTLTNAGTSQSRATTSSDQGYFNFPDLAPGVYNVVVEKNGFKRWEQSSITLAVSQQITLYPALQIGSTNEQVVVTAQAAFLTTDSSSLSGVVESNQIEQLPLNGRNALQLESLEPGVVSTGTGGQFGATQTMFAASGGRDIDTNYSLDGGINIDSFYDVAANYPNPDALQEFSVSSRNYSARFGRGSTDVSAVTRSGGNDWHGSLFEFVRTTDLDATPYFSAAPPPFHRNQFGGAVGGPIRKNKMFFFASYQGTQQSGGPGEQTYPTVTLAERTGDFSALSTPVIDPKTGTQFSGNIIPSSRITSQATNFFTTYLPAPNLGNNEFIFPNVGTLAEHQAVGKVDYQLTAKDLISVRYFLDDLPQIGYLSAADALNTNWLTQLPFRYQSTTIGYVRTFSPNLLNDAHISYVRTSFGELVSLPFSLNAIGYSINTTNAVSNWGLTPDSELAVGGAFTAYPGAPTRDITPSYDTNDNLSWIKGRQSLGAGIQIYHNRINETQNFLTGGYLKFSGQFSGVAAADFMLGDFATYEQISGLSSHLHQTLPSTYVQDDIKLTKQLTLNAGVRWDIVTGYTSENNQLMTFKAGSQSTVFPLAPTGLLYPGDQGVPKDIIGTRWNDFAPRLGFAWDVFGNGKTSLRSGIGIYYVPLSRGISLNDLTLIQPFTLEVVISGGNAENIWGEAPYNGVSPFPRPTSTSGLKNQPFVPTAAETAMSTNWKTQTSAQWSLSIQQSLSKSAVLEADYVASSSSHLFGSSEVNPGIYIPGASTESNLQSRRPYPQIGHVEFLEDGASSNYNALQLVYNQNLQNKILLKSAYTWSKNLGVNINEAAGSTSLRNPSNWKLDYGPVPSSVGQNWITSVIWTPLAGYSFRPLLKETIAGWQVGGISTIQSGTPLTFLSGVDNSLTGIGHDTPNGVGNYKLGKQSKAQQMAHYYNAAAFVQNPTGTIGTFRPNSLVNPGYINFDINLQKNFTFRDRYGLQFRSSLYNAFNHSNLNAPVATLTSSAFDKIISTTNPRVIEFGLRLSY